MCVCPLIHAHSQSRCVWLDQSEAEARAILEDCLRVLWYRDTRALNKIQLAKVWVQLVRPAVIS
jgi:hypothetical protein